MTMVLLTACGSGSGGGYNEVPRSYIDTTYSRSGSYWTTGTMSPRQVAADIDRNTQAGNRVTKTDRVYLRYRNHVVRVNSNASGGSRIEISSYRTAHRAWNSDIGGVWPVPGPSGNGGGGGSSGGGGGGGFRGGGPGSGK
ncbi:DUF4247 domain-containing protein [Streptomyces bohaiensis]|uniref:DUF4247 domain-containing protein n=1 Tax=Streptomyces bohaiensis TaxID=1431344 RepID=A0ABX1CHC9_9ACTN|nr:DUF4247 domain-containing protein [Streptomyces bohaiensis]NJQ17568.1 DUF4247 domain-containing protein [Streptomyces bohaiensis]